MHPMGDLTMQYNYGSKYDVMSVDEIRERDTADRPTWVNDNTKRIGVLMASPHCVVVGVAHTNAGGVDAPSTPHSVDNTDGMFNPFTANMVKLTVWAANNGFNTPSMVTRVRQHARNGRLPNSIMMFGTWIMDATTDVPTALSHPSRGRSVRTDGRVPFTVYALPDEITAMRDHATITLRMPDDAIIDPRAKRREQRDAKRERDANGA